MVISTLKQNIGLLNTNIKIKSSEIFALGNMEKSFEKYKGVCQKRTKP